MTGEKLDIGALVEQLNNSDLDFVKRYDHLRELSNYGKEETVPVYLSFIGNSDEDLLMRLDSASFLGILMPHIETDVQKDIFIALAKFQKELKGIDISGYRKTIMEGRYRERFDYISNEIVSDFFTIFGIILNGPPSWFDSEYPESRIIYSSKVSAKQLPLSRWIFEKNNLFYAGQGEILQAANSTRYYKNDESRAKLELGIEVENWRNNYYVPFHGQGLIDRAMKASGQTEYHKLIGQKVNVHILRTAKYNYQCCGITKKE